MSKDLLIIISVILVFSLAVYFICKYKNRNPWGWIVLVNVSGFIFNFAPFIIVIILLFLPKEKKEFDSDLDFRNIKKNEKTISIYFIRIDVVQCWICGTKSITCFNLL